jgi:hypothetical protein
MKRQYLKRGLNRDNGESTYIRSRELAATMRRSKVERLFSNINLLGQFIKKYHLLNIIELHK